MSKSKKPVESSESRVINILKTTQDPFFAWILCLCALCDSEELNVEMLQNTLHLTGQQAADIYRQATALANQGKVKLQGSKALIKLLPSPTLKGLGFFSPETKESK
jgi:hypothetical protein